MLRTLRTSITATMAAASLLILGCGAADGEGAGPGEGPSGGGGSSGSSTGGSSGSGDLEWNVVAPAPSGGCGDGEPATVLFVVDRSGSMKCNLPEITPSTDCESIADRVDPNAPSKWEIVSQVMAANLGALVPQSDTDIPVAAGLSFFSRDNSCGVLSQPDVAIAPMDDQQVQFLQSGLFGQTPAGPTPIVGALVTAYRHLHEELRANGNRYVVLLTDGSDPCQDQYTKTFNAQGIPAPADFIQDLLQVQVPNAVAANIRTFVVGAPGSEANAWMLSALAVAGGTAPEGCNPQTESCHYDTTNGSFEEQFQLAMESITAAVSCPSIM